MKLYKGQALLLQIAQVVLQSQLAAGSRFVSPLLLEISTPVTSVLWGPASFFISETRVKYFEDQCSVFPYSPNTIFALRGQWCSFEHRLCLLCLCAFPLLLESLFFPEAINAQNAGAVAVLWISDRTRWQVTKGMQSIEVPGTFALTRSGESTDNINIPFVEIPEGEIPDDLLKLIKSSNGTVTMELTPGTNLYLEWLQNW
ncbi:hypothetical protein HK096_001639, partial [Nowakowskiella sp. JEL0078]